ncbi:uncharacterized protein CELE_T20B12.5 [Caenorhabditis elegans]|uniref:Uncharacterized protein T20B12.5 n=1 Tax=Caenorhabditis elegans TaxID=6239 RepID=YO95_CAEEL|nr:Uncharacterized protein CELE_T20B12.5 [Caenorhabditis elegans]P41845.1 RecName: Full=Uncharacterized protein T20B12.5 [Caenorhabditis elegans]CCD69074.1 Uncharacterized protein CELE_T20B12.5 [Caenorhabditis elegans]|eukprot:NP_498629.1 Uncharacterized protein CELE_T20B12.5 [Caenorhabditis elegans]
MTKHLLLMLQILYVLRIFRTQMVIQTSPVRSIYQNLRIHHVFQIREILLLHMAHEVLHFYCCLGFSPFFYNSRFLQFKVSIRCPLFHAQNIFNSKLEKYECTFKYYSNPLLVNVIILFGLRISVWKWLYLT